MQVSKSFEAFAKEAPEFHAAWMEAVSKLDSAGSLDKKTKELAYIAVLAAMRLESGLPFHVKMAKMLGASRNEIINTILVGLPAAGNVVISALPIALDAYDEE
jgi:alkylhydroperoxidase/carboxymuconolactone decarboxylase family protein YurZ